MSKPVRPNFLKNDRITLASHVATVPTYDGKPHIAHDTELSVSHIAGRGTKREPWKVVATDGVHFWHFDPEDVERLSIIKP